LSQIHEPLVADAEKACHIREAIELDEPSIKEALNSSNRDLWEAAMFPSRFVIKVKRNSDGTLERRKARLFILGNLQRPFVDFYDTYSPVADFVVVRVVLSTAWSKHWVVHQLDVKSAFLNGYIDK
jgi:Reverse transcriptase (RNA-dependent DNA polymerase)